MCLNDAFDVIYDREHRPERPIPGGLVSVDAAWRWGFGALSLGWVTLILAGPRTGVIGFVLLGTIILYDAVHKSLSVAPLVVGLCRCLVYLVAASAASDGVTGLTVWSGLAVVLYVTGQRCLARRERSKGPVEAWPVWLLTAPLLLALVANGGSYLVRSLVISCLASAWVLRSLYFTFGAPVRNVGLTVSGLTSGLVWMDALAVAGGDPLRWSLVFVGLFLAAFVAQRLIPSP
jgi:4-hydroxybenzoate polyprenyltransferase